MMDNVFRSLDGPPLPTVGRPFLAASPALGGRYAADIARPLDFDLGAPAVKPSPFGAHDRYLHDPLDALDDKLFSSASPQPRPTVATALFGLDDDAVPDYAKDTVPRRDPFPRDLPSLSRDPSPLSATVTPRQRPAAPEPGSALSEPEEIVHEAGKDIKDLKDRTPARSARKPHTAVDRTPQVAHCLGMLRRGRDSPAEHSQAHILDRRFRLVASGVPADPAPLSAAALPVTCTVQRVFGDDEAHESGPVLGCAEEVSAIVNVGDATQCRLIDVRTAFGEEREALLSYCDATTTVAATLNDDLTARFGDDDEQSAPGTPTEQTLPPEEAGFPGRSAGAETDVYEAGKALQPLCGPAADSALHDVLDTLRSGEVSAAGGSGLLKIFGALVAEASGEAVAPAECHFDAAGHWAKAQALGTREAEAKAAGNLQLCTQLRRELVASLNGALHDGLDTAQVGEAPLRKLPAAREETDAVAAVLRRETTAQAASVEAALATAQGRAAAAASQLVALETVATEQREGVMRELRGSDRTIRGVLDEMDRLYGRLEAALDTRHRLLKDHTQALGVTAVRRGHAAAVASRADRALELVAARAGSARVAAAASDACGPLIASLRSAVDTKAADAVGAMGGHRARCLSDCDELYAELQTCAGGWVDALMKNVTREQDRAAQLRASIRDATERYHQEDRDLFERQLAEAEERMHTAQREAASFTALLADAAERMARAGRSAAPPVAASVPQTPQRVAAPRFAHQTAHQTPGYAAHQDPHAALCQSPAEAPRGESEETALVHCPAGLGEEGAAVDGLGVDDIVALFRKPAAVSDRWRTLLLDLDVESGRDLRDLRETREIWASLFPQAPLLKAQLELLLDFPARFVAVEVDDVRTPRGPRAAPA